MTGIRFESSADGQKVVLNLYGLDQPSPSETDLLNLFNRTEFRNYHLNEESLQAACKIFKKLQLENKATNEDSTAKPPPHNSQEPAVSLVVAEKREATLAVEISDDRQECFLVVETAFGGTNPDAPEFGRCLQAAGVVKGLKQNILAAIAQKQENVPPGTRIRERVAEGKPPGESTAARLEYRVVPVQDRLLKPVLQDDGSVDMHDFGEIQVVQVGEVLVERIPPIVGEPGFNVLGELVPAAKPHDVQLVPGEGTELGASNRNQLVAARKGVPMKLHDGMSVADAYCVEDVDLRTGNINFDGSVVVQGSVTRGMSVRATGDVMVRDYVESAEVHAGGNLVIGKGILGHQAEEKSTDGKLPVYSARISCDQDVHVNYAQYADIRAEGTVTVAKHIMHCYVAARSIVVVSPKRTEGKILGGILYPQEKLECNTLGTPSYIATLVDFSRTFSAELEQLKKLNTELGERVNVVRGMRVALRQIDARSSSRDAEEQASKIENTVLHFERLIAALKEERKQLMDVLISRRDGLEITVHKTLFPGVSVRFLDREFPVREEKNICQIKAKNDGLAFITLK